MPPPEHPVQCRIFRGTRQAELYLYLRSDVELATLPQALLHRLGSLTPVMQLALTPLRKLARVDVDEVIRQLQSKGWFLQLPPDGMIAANLHFGD
ncbi:MAG: YcgL domain-containing protein [Panacagrimonas sp.]